MDFPPGWLVVILLNINSVHFLVKTPTQLQSNLKPTIEGGWT